MEPFRQKGSSMASWSTFIFKSVTKIIYIHITKMTETEIKNDKAHSKIKTKPWNIKNKHLIQMINTYSLNNMITLISGGDFCVNISAGYIDTPVRGKTIMALWASNCYYSSN